MLTLKIGVDTPTARAGLLLKLGGRSGRFESRPLATFVIMRLLYGYLDFFSTRLTSDNTMLDQLFLMWFAEFNTAAGWLEDPVPRAPPPHDRHILGCRPTLYSNLCHHIAHQVLTDQTLNETRRIHR